MVIIVGRAQTGNPLLYHFPLLAKDPFCLKFNEKGFSDLGLVKFIVSDEAVVLGWLNYFWCLGWQSTP
jgi:hypothetical protein